MRRRIAWALLWAAGAVLGAEHRDDPDALLERIRERAKENLTRLPDYICVQTIERTRRAEPQGDYARLDTLRLEVGLSGDKEIFAWPDSARFGEQDVTDLVQRGTIGNGAFAMHARNVLLSGAPEFEFHGQETVNNRPAFRLNFDVPLDRSAYRLRVRPNEARVAFHGSLWADVETLDLVRLKVEVDDIPPELGLAAADDEMNYARVRIGGGDFLLPESSELNMISLAGDASRNRTTFSRCRQYVGESSISFQLSESGSPAPSREHSDGGLPRGAALELKLASEIDARNARVGDPVVAEVARPLKDARQAVVPEGAQLHGRLVRLELYDQPIGHFVIALEFHTLEVSGRRTPIRATMRKAGPSPGLVEQAKRFDPTFDPRRNKPFMQMLVNEQQSGQGVLYWKAKNPIVGKGLRMHWELEP